MLYDESEKVETTECEILIEAYTHNLIGDLCRGCGAGIPVASGDSLMYT